MTQNFVTFEGKKYYPDGDILALDYKGISDINDIKGLEQLRNIRHLILLGNKIEDIKGLEHLTKLEILDLSTNKIRKIKGLEHLKQLKELDLSDNRINEIKGLEHLTNLEKLDISENAITEIKGLENLANLQELIIWKKDWEEYIQDKQIEHGHVGAYDNPIRYGERFLFYESAQDVVKYCQDKKEGKLEFVTVEGKKYYVRNELLDLRDAGITDITKIDGLNKLKNLTGLWLDHNGIKEIKGLENLTNLHSLSLWNNAIAELKGIETLSNLEVFEIFNNPLRHDEAEKVIEFSPHKAVKYCQDKRDGKIPFVTLWEEKYYTAFGTLDLSRLDIRDIKNIKGLNKLSNLKRLDLSNNLLKEIRGLGHLTNLQHLDLRNNPIKDDERHLVDVGLANAQEVIRYCQTKPDYKKEIKRDQKFVRFKDKKYHVEEGTLDLSGIGITDMNEIEGLEQLKNLRELDLSDNQIIEIKSLEALTGLQEFYLSNNRITEINGLENLTKLSYLDLNSNPIKEDELHLIEKSAQEVVRYCQEKVRKAEG